MNEFIEQERDDIARMKEIYDRALMNLIGAAFHVEILLHRSDIKGISSDIIQKNLEEIGDCDVSIIINGQPVAYPTPSYYADLIIKKHNGSDDDLTIKDCQIKNYELPTLLEKSVNVITRK